MSQVRATINLDADGRQVGDLCLRWSDNSVPLGYHPVPIISLRNGAGPVVVICAGTHGDEFEGPSAIMRVLDGLRPKDITGQIIALPALNAPAVRGSSRVSPLDGVNLNRAFPGDAAGGITAQIADYVETVLLPRADAALDLHSGGKASVFAPCSLPTRTKDTALFARNLELAKVFGLPLCWVLGGFNDARSLNSAAERAGVAMIATELGGGGGCDPAITGMAEKGIRHVMRHVGVLAGANVMPAALRQVEIATPEHSLFAPGDGVFDRVTHAGTDVKAGDLAGTLHYVNEPRRPSEPVYFPADGMVLAHTNRGYVARADMLMLVVQDID